MNGQRMTAQVQVSRRQRLNRRLTRRQTVSRQRQAKQSHQSHFSLPLELTSWSTDLPLRCACHVLDAGKWGAVKRTSKSKLQFVDHAVATRD